MKNINAIILVAALFVLSGTSISQFSQEWLVRENGTGNSADYANSITVDASGNVYVTGSMIGSGGTSNDFATIKYNNAGVQQWKSLYNGPASSIDKGIIVKVDVSGNVYVTGSSSGTNGSNIDYATVKYNSSGVQQWAMRYDGPGSSSDEPTSMAIDELGNVYITGFSTGSGTGNDYATIKYNSAGIEQWAVRYNGPGNGIDKAYSIGLDGSGNVYITGESAGSGTGSDFTTIKYNSGGVQQWAERYTVPGSLTDRALSLAVDNSGNVFVTGTTTLSGTNSDAVTIKYNTLGVQQWLVSYNSPANNQDAGHFIKLDALGNVFVAGTSVLAGTNRDYLTIKYNSTGVEQWTARYDGPGSALEQPYGMAVDALGNVYVTGYSAESGVNFDYATVKYNSSGTQQWADRYNGPANGSDAAYSIAVDGLSNVYVTGGSTGSGSNNDYATIKYSQPIGISPISGEMPTAFSLSQNYPNPFNPATNIEFAVPKSTFVKLVVFDVSGRELETLVSQNMTAGIYKAEWDASKYSSGIYFYRLEAEGFLKTSKMMLLK